MISMVFRFFEVKSLPDQDFDRGILLEALGRKTFMVVYDLSRKSTILALDDQDTEAASKAPLVIPGLSFSEIGDYGNTRMGLHISPVYRKVDTISPMLFGDVFTMQDGEGFVSLMFKPLNVDEIGRSKTLVEKLLGEKVVRETSSVLNGSAISRTSNSQQKELFTGSEERMMLTDILESLNLATLSGMRVYSIFAVFTESAGIKEYVNSRLFTMGDTRTQSSLSDCGKVRKPDSIPVGISIAKNFLNFYGVKELRYSLKTMEPGHTGDIDVGTFMKDAVHDTGEMVSVDHSLLNLGFIITGLPGSGKTMEAMSIIDSIIEKNDNRRVVIISPTDEWNGFALRHGMYLLKIYQDRVPINFFRCIEGIEVSQFYEDLAMLLSSSSDAGPYRNPMEKCMLNAFKNVYSGGEKDPDPVAVYEEIEEAVIRLHAKRSNIGVRYTKHGENIISALENLRSIIRRPEYSSRGGVKLEELIDRGVVFDLSGVSNKIKPSIYALLLNQAYMLAGSFDTNGDDRLRLLICLEESQIVLGQRNSATVEDIGHRIQDFRKKGVGLMLLAHNADDLDEGIRRLCQIKLYLKQAPDIAEIATKDLVFTYADKEAISMKLKHLDSRVGAFSYMVRRGEEKIACDSIFLRTMDYEYGINPRVEKGQEGAITEYLEREGIDTPEQINTKLHVSIKVEQTKKEIKPDKLILRVMYLKEAVASYALSELPMDGVEVRLIKDRKYSAEMVNENYRTISRTYFISGRDVHIVFMI